MTARMWWAIRHWWHMPSSWAMSARYHDVIPPRVDWDGKPMSWGSYLRYLRIRPPRVKEVAWWLWTWLNVHRYFRCHGDHSNRYTAWTVSVCDWLENNARAQEDW